jgi:AcrR family transcriptional regulator
MTRSRSPSRSRPASRGSSRSAVEPGLPGGGDPADRAYHHGDLRRALLEAGLKILREEGLEALTLRATARATGVSQTAPYRHFADRTALLAGVAEDGFRRLRLRMQQAASAPPPPGSTARQTLQALALEYFRFAFEYPAEYRLMFGSELGSRPPEALPLDLREAQESVYAFLRGGIMRTQALGLVRAGDPGTMAFTSWALLHGLVMLVLDGRMAKAGTLSAEELVVEATNLLMTGMSA